MFGCDGMTRRRRMRAVEEEIVHRAAEIPKLGAKDGEQVEKGYAVGACEVS